MQKDELNTIKFAAIVCLICSMGLAGVKGTLNAKQEYNKKIDQQVNVLKALFPSFTPDGEELDMDRRDELFTQGQVPKEWIPQYFDQFVEIEDIELADGEKGKLYKLKKDDQLKSVAFPAQGKGLWSTVHSYVGLEPDLATIKGVTFFDHGETPGLGGECSKPWFQRNFRGKSLLENGEPAEFEVVKGKAEEGDSHAVDGMSGATITGNGIQRFLNDTYRKYYTSVFKQMRSES